jgi:hypothetical protein
LSARSCAANNAERVNDEALPRDLPFFVAVFISTCVDSEWNPVTGLNIPFLALKSILEIIFVDAGRLGLKWKQAREDAYI